MGSMALTVEREADKETTMYSYDTNINTAIERQADRLRAVQAYGSRRLQAPATDGTGQSNPVARKFALALAAATPIMLVVAWGLSAR